MELRGRGGIERGKGLSLGIPRDENQLITVLELLGVEVESVADDEIRLLCPFHGNTDTSAMAMSNPEGVFFCHNPMCGETGTLVDMVQKLRRVGYFEAARIIDNAHVGDSFQVSIVKRKKKEPLVIPPETYGRWHKDLLANDHALDYLRGRGITDESIEHFMLGYSVQQNLIITPVFDEEGKCIGGVGRGVDAKVFKNTPGTTSSLSLFNIQNARKEEYVIVCESNFDAIRIHQAGFPNVVATLGSNFSENHLAQVVNHFSKVVIMTDDDGNEVRANCRLCKNEGMRFCVGHNAGRNLGEKIAKMCLKAGVTPRWAVTGCGTIYPEGVKDAGDMTDEQIYTCIRNSVSNFEYNTLYK